MRRWIGCLAGVGTLAMLGVIPAAGQQRPGTVIVPPTSVEHPSDVGVRSHTNFLIFVPAAGKPGPSASNASPSGETPQSLSCVYQTWAGNVAGCPVGGSYAAPSGGTKAIAIVDAYDYPTATSDFNTFSAQFGLPATGCDGNAGDSCLNVVYAAGSQPAENCGWAQEAALDIEWAHAMAPNAQIILVEAASNNNSDLLYAVQKASDLVAAAGGGEVSMSWGGSEFRGESTDDSYFATPGVTYFASSGDSGSKVIWPSASANVISAGGTSVNRDSGGNFLGETVWSSAGGGPSRFEPVPSYQSSIYSLAQLLGNYRGTPDISFDADPSTGVSVYDSTACSGLVDWMVFGGTSVASPSLAGIANASGALSGGWDSGTNSNSTADNLYNNYNSTSNGGNSCGYTSTFSDITSGSAGHYSATGCWDFASGIGSDRGLTGFGSGSSSSTPDFSISASPSSQSVTAGGETSYTVTVTALNGYAGTVGLNATGLPGDATFSFSPSTVTGSGTSTLTVTTGTTTGTFTVTITGTDTGNNLTHSTTVTLVVNAPVTGDFSISASPSSVIISAKGTASYTITVTSLSGFSGSVTLSISEAIPQSRAALSVDPVTVTSGGSATSTLTVSTGPKTTPGTYTITITGTSGGLTRPTSVTLTVQ